MQIPGVSLDVPPVHSSAVASLIEWGGPQPDDVLAAMTARAERDGFPTVGPEVGRILALCTRLLDARSVLALGSGFGYSAYWIARVFPHDGQIRLTERDDQLLDDARSYFEAGGLADRAIFQNGDALELATNHDGSTDLVVLDHDTGEYVRGFEAVRDGVEPGSAVVADNVANYDDVLTPEDLAATLDGNPASNERTRAVATYLRRVRDDPTFETYLLPVGEGIAVSVRLEE